MMSPMKSLPHGLLIGLVLVCLFVQEPVNGESSEKDFEFDDVQVVVQKRSTANTLKDDEDFLQDEGSGDVEGSGTGGVIPPTVPEFFRCVMNITSILYRDELGDSSSAAFRELSGKVASAVKLLFDKVPGQQTVVVLQFSPGSLMVTFDLGSQGFQDRSALFNTLNNALQSGVISPFTVSPVGFEFRPLQDGSVCPSYVGRDPEPLPRIGDNRANFLINNIFPCRGYVIAWQYYRIIPRYSGYVGIWRQTDDYKFTLIGKTELPTINTVGNITVTLPTPILAEKGDFIGVFYSRAAEEGVVASANDETQGISIRELYTNYYAAAYDGDFTVGSEFNLEKTTFEETKATFAIKAIMDYTSIGNVPKQCLPDQFQCASGECIDAIFKCDSQDDCFDGSDEKNCPVTVCREDEFRCSDNRQCIPLAFRCNLQRDCVDGSDEERCAKTCTTDEFQCSDGACISQTYRCDGVPNDCPDNSDETLCDGAPQSCPEGLLRCDNGDCVNGKRCDGLPECRDGSDESNCETSTIPPTLTPEICTADQFRCDDGMCIPDDLICDGTPDCDDRSDEFLSLCGATALCPEGQFKCDNGDCVGADAPCNLVRDCADGSDEAVKNCGPRVQLEITKSQQVYNEGETAIFDCAATGNIGVTIRWKTKDGPLPAKAVLQNGRLSIPNVTIGDVTDYICYTDTVPGVEEVVVDLLVIPACRADQVPCSDGSCVDRTYLCDGYQDCLDGADEKNCSTTKDCPQGQYKCDDSTCAPPGSNCDGKVDCGDGSDEFPRYCGCRIGEYMCADGKQCISKLEECDGRINCPDRSDEHANCTVTCRTDEYTCRSGQCIDRDRLCDGYPDCTDRSDEEDRACRKCDSASQFTCRFDHQCVNVSMVCDGFADCVDRSDEMNCPCSKTSEFTCASGQCIDIRKQCDRIKDCFDGSDESGCSCRSDEFTCISDGKCVPRTDRCNRRRDCQDGSDESDCPCSKTSEFTCASGQCIDIRKQCDRIKDCFDGSDESGCSCRSDEFTCISDGKCVPRTDRCNRRRDCQDGSDESDCQGENCSPFEFLCTVGGCVESIKQCDGYFDCPDGSDEFLCTSPTTIAPTERPLIITISPPSLRLREGREARFRCQASRNVPLSWSRRSNNGSLPYRASVENDILTIPELQPLDSGSYICTVVGQEQRYFAIATLDVQSLVPPTLPPTGICRPGEAVCQNLQCINADYRCDGDRDCEDGSDEDPSLCNFDKLCEPNEFKCANGRCAMKIWRCDGDNDCGDDSDEQNCPTRGIGDRCDAKEYQCTSGDQCVPASYQCDGEIDCQDRSDEIGCAAPSINIAPPPNIEVEVGGYFTIICEAVGTPTPLIVWRLNWGNIPSGDRVYVSSINGRGNLTITDARVEDSGAYTCEAINVKGSIFASPDAIIIVRRTPQGICEPPKFNVEASINTDCLNCFCFGHTTQCYSSDLQISKIDLVGELKMVNLNSSLPIDERYVEYLPTGEYGGFYQVGDGLRLVPPGIYYWSLPGEFLGERLTSYGGTLHYDIYYSLGRDQSKILDQADVIMRGNGITIYHRSSTIAVPEGKTRFEVPLLPSAWTKGDMPRRGDTPVLEYATREDLMMVLENLEYIYVRSHYDSSMALTRIGNIELSSGVRETTGLGRAVYVEKCECPPGYSGLSCQDCAPGYTRVQQGPYLGICTRCNCYGHSADCDPLTGTCRFCDHNTEGRQCERCATGFYGDAKLGTLDACKPCPCPLTTPTNQFSETCVLNSDGRPTCTACKPGYIGRNCERCATGYVGRPNIVGNYCRKVNLPDICDSRGSYSRQPDPVTGCRCKSNVVGKNCDQCRENTFYLDAANPFGCLRCFCMGVTNQCTSTSWNKAQIGATFTRNSNDFVLTDLLQRETISDGFTVNSNVRELGYRRFNNQKDTVYYWSLPKRFLGDKVISYGGYLKFVLVYRPGQDASPSELDGPLVELIGNGVTLIHNSTQEHRPNTPMSYRVPFTENAWTGLDGAATSREFLLMALADLNAILIRATFTKDTDQSSIRDVVMDIAEDRVTGQGRASTVEQCQCPRGYKGLSCEDCDVGYTRSGSGTYLGTCEPCQCNGHSSECDPDTGRCRNCQHNTDGEQCERCATGFYGDATRGTPSDCQPCPCPLTQPPNQFSPTCELARDGQVRCTACPAGHTGRRCESCIQGYSGNPMQQGDYCKISTGPNCQCDSRGIVPNTQCDALTKQCQCKANVRGQRCSFCKESYFHLSEENSQGCLACWCSGVARQCSSSAFYKDRIYPNFSGADTHNFVLTNRRMSNSITDGFVVNTDRNEIIFNQFTGIQRERESLFFSLPPKFRGNKVTSYGGFLSFTLETVVALDGGATFRDVDIEIITPGQRQRMYYLFNPPSQPYQPETYKIHLVESSFRMLDGTSPTRETFMSVLSNIEAILIRATYHSIMGSASLRDLYMDTSSSNPTTFGRMPQVESCQCPEGYTGSSCEQCAPGYLLQEDGVGRRCTRCSCNNHADSCDPRTGQCLNCQHNTVGDRCERCDEGFYGDATSGTASDCRPCPCPLTVPSNQFSRTCRLDTDGLPTCVRCPEGYLGRDCGTCDAARGYTGNPREIGGLCTAGATLEPVVEASPLRVEEPVGHTVIFTCEVTGSGPFNVVWTRANRQPLPLRANISPRYTLTIRDLVQTDSGQYICTATNRHGSTRGIVTLQVTGREQPIRVRIDEPTSAVKTQGQSVRFVCTASGSNTMTYILAWSKQGGILPSKATERNGVLVIPNVQPEDAGSYVCTGSDIMSTDTAIAVLTVSATETAPEIRIEPRFQTVKEGQEMEFRCLAVSGRPTPTLEWRRKGGRYPMNSEATFNNGVFRIPVALQSDEGEYYCKGTNVAGMSEIRTILYVQRDENKPEVIVLVRQVNVVAVVGTTAELVCYVDGVQTQLVWSRSGGLPPGSTQRGGVLSIPNIQPSGDGRYICTAVTPTGDKGTVTATITVQTGSIAVRPTATIDVPSQRLNVDQGSTATIRCVVTGEPQPTVTWSKSRGVLTDRHRVTRGTLRIVGAQMEDRGIYICVAENTAGSSQAWVIVEVLPREKPVITLYPKDSATATVGGSAMFVCRASGEPKPTVTWTRAGDEAFVSGTTEIKQDGVLMFSRVTGAEQGSYTCTATNSMGFISASATLLIAGPPRVVIQPSRTVYAVIGQRISLECVAQGVPTPSVYWRYESSPDRGDLPVSSVDSALKTGSATLTIESVSNVDTGNYVCVATNDAGSVEETAQIIVRDENPNVPGVTIDGPQTRSATEGQSVTLRCETQGLTNAVVQWRRREGPLPPNHSIQGGTLYIPRFQREYAGEYICTATTPVRNYETSIFIIVTVTPKLSISPAQVEARAGQTVQLRCQPQGQGPFNIEWVKIGGVLSPSATQTADGILEIRRVSAADAGRYRCVATNSAGSSDGIAVVRVQVPPRIVVSNRDQSVREGETVTLQCQITGTPQPQVTWEKQGGSLPSNSDIRNDVLTIYNVRSEDTGRYICNARSTAGIARDFIMVTVLSGGGGGGSIQYDTQTVSIGEKVEMECVTTGSPQPIVTWSRLDGQLPPSAIVSDAFLVIQSIRQEDAGTYVCTVQNIVGKVEKRVTLFVRAKPIITGGTESLTAALGSSASMSCEAVGYPQPEISWYKRDGKMPRGYSVDAGALKIDRLRPEDAGTYICNAQNDVGKNEHTTNLLVGDLVPYFDQEPVSYISYPPIEDHHINFEILLSLRPETTDGMVLYNGQYDSARGDYVCFGMRGGYPEFAFDVGSGPALIQGNRTLSLNKWNSIKLKRQNSVGSMEVNDEPVYTGSSLGQFSGLDLGQNMYLGNVPDVSNIPEPARYPSGFVGAVSQVIINGKDLNLGADAVELKGIEPYNACKDRPCLNRGRCFPANSKYGYKCECPTGFSGTRCETTGKGCYPGICGPGGRCRNLTGDHQCICPMGRIGARCAQAVQVIYPQFNGSSFSSYNPIRNARFQMKIELEIKPQSLDDGLVLYSGQNEDGSGDYVVILMKDNYLEFRYNTGSGPALMKSKKKLISNEWVRITATKSGQEGSLVINNEDPVKGTSPGTYIGLDLRTKLYLGGMDPDKKVPDDVEVKEGFYGCIAELKINMQSTDLTRDARETLDVRDCGETDICNRYPCRNGGTCQGGTAVGYSCLCPASYTGKNCEVEINLCLTQRPCRNNGACSVTNTGYRCDCPLGFMGKNCEAVVQLGENIEVNFDGFVEFNKSFLSATSQEEEVIKFTLKTTEKNGLVLWKGQTMPLQRSSSVDYLSIGLEDGYVLYSYDLGSGPSRIKSPITIDDGYAHIIQVTRLGRQGSLIIDNNLSYSTSGQSQGPLQSLNTAGNVFIGGVSLVSTITKQKYMENYSGCISDIYLQDKGPLRIPEDAIGGFNVRPCLNKK
ncbi:basement membrane-specific heparan sulfate proteoglycan core protein-like isoform X3 [Ostrea edulis]|uniref:basement membrane-specific heparan sulfate proteoglycan core protein-like isoform X3 n=1 Tax=Ostrea edulis TaxID=37623 RepID=UPI0024AF1F13|nr:basement membrane-specific heparan sulfate proteoglycan core protein-like isoform X3 [Ostrea edulis]